MKKLIFIMTLAIMTAFLAFGPGWAQAQLSGYGFVKSNELNYSDGGWAGWSVPNDKVVLGGGFNLTGGPAAVSVPGTPNSVWPHYTYGADEYGWVVRDDPDGETNYGSFVYAVYADLPAGYEVFKSGPMYFSDGGWAGWSCPAGKVVLGGGFYHTDPVAVSVPGTPNSVWPHYTYGADEYGWVVRDDPDGVNPDDPSYVYVICADEPIGYEVFKSGPQNFSDGGWAGWSCPAGKVVLGGGFYHTDPVAVSVPGTPNSVWPHYTYGADEYGWVVRDDPDGVNPDDPSYVYVICADEPPTCEGYCGGMNPSGCWCDDKCEQYGDCCEGVCDDCPDLSHCQQPGGDCQGFCGRKSPAGCWCDEQCVKYGDCCEGVCDDCPDLFHCQEPTCEGYCGGQSPFGCWCDDKCEQYGDCCEGVCDDCPDLSHCQPGDCQGFCGRKSPAGCWCDEACKDLGDCCEGVCDECPNLSHCQEPTCKGYCGGQSPFGCWCDTACKTYNDCCPDYDKYCVATGDVSGGRSSQSVR